MQISSGFGVLNGKALAWQDLISVFPIGIYMVCFLHLQLGGGKLACIRCSQEQVELTERCKLASSPFPESFVQGDKRKCSTHVPKCEVRCL